MMDAAEMAHSLHTAGKAGKPPDFCAKPTFSLNSNNSSNFSKSLPKVPLFAKVLLVNVVIKNAKTAMHQVVLRDRICKLSSLCIWSCAQHSWPVASECSDLDCVVVHLVAVTLLSRLYVV